MTTYYIDSAIGNDANPGTAPGAGNAWATIGHALATIAPGDICYVKASATYSIATGLTFNPASQNYPTRLVGYTTTPGDGGRATIRVSAAIVGLTISGYGGRVENFVIDGNAIGTTGIVLSTYYNNILNCALTNWITYGLDLTSGYPVGIIGTTISGCTGASAVHVTAGGSIFHACTIHNNTGIGVSCNGANVNFVNSSIYANGGDGISCAGGGTPVTVIGCRIYSNGGNGITLPSPIGFIVQQCTIHSNTNDGVNITGYDIPTSFMNNIFTGNGGYGLNMLGMSVASIDPVIDYNWFGTGAMANTSGPRNMILAGPHDLSGDPQYVNAAAGDFTPQNPAVKAAFPSGWIGAVQPAGGGGAVALSPIGSGFIRGRS